jgi:hypothetical protein
MGHFPNDSIFNALTRYPTANIETLLRMDLLNLKTKKKLILHDNEEEIANFPVQKISLITSSVLK